MSEQLQATMPKEIVEAISAMMLKVGYVQKKGTNTFHNYKYASIEDVLEKVQPALAEVGLIITQTEVGHDIIADGHLMEARYDFGLHKGGVSAMTIRHTGLAALRNTKGGYDDKALNKCHTAARKYFILGLFQIPTGLAVDPDEDEDKPPVQKAPTQVHPAPAQSTMAGRKVEADGVRAAREWVNAEAIPAVKACKTAEALNVWIAENKKRMRDIKEIVPDDFAALNHRIGLMADSFNAVAAG